jgi:hypothetical protein
MLNICLSYVAGKTTLALRLLKHEKDMFSTPFENYYWCLPHGSVPPSSLHSDFQIHYGVPDGATLPTNSIVFLDDLQHEQGLESQLLHTVHSHHRNLTVVCLNHSIFPKNNRFHRDQTQSTKYMIICKNPRDTQSFFRLAIQLESGGRARSLYQSYLDACSRPFGYLLCDLTQRVHPALRYRSCLFPDDKEGLCIYASDEDLNRLIQDDPSYERFSEAIHALTPSAPLCQQDEETGSIEHP